MKLDKNELVITIDSEPGCNGDWIGKRMSNILGIPCYGKEILYKAAELSGISRDLMVRYDGRPVNAAYDLLAKDESALRIPPARDFIHAQVAASRELAANGHASLWTVTQRQHLREIKNTSVFLSTAILKTEQKFTVCKKD